MKLYFLALATLLIVCVGCAYDGQQAMHRNEFHAPPAEMMVRPGPMVGGPGPGVIGPMATGVTQAGYQCPAPMMAMPAMPPAEMRTSQVRFLGPEGMSIGWQIGSGFAENQLMAPASYNFTQAATYRLKLEKIPGREMPPIYPTLHVYPAHPTTEAFLAHNPIPIRINDEDLDQVSTSNFVTKVIYLPDAKYQELAVAGVTELVSTRLPLGQDPIMEADRRGTILAVLRMGNLDLEMPGQPGPMGATRGPDGKIQQASAEVVNGEAGQYVAPVAIADFTGAGGAVPSDVLVQGPTGPIRAAGPGCGPNLVAGVNLPVYGYPYVGTPIGLPGPPHVPLGRPAGLQSHTMRNLTDVDVGEPVDHMLIDVKHDPGLSLPHPVKHVQYTEKHPVYSPGEVAVPAGASVYGVAPGMGAAGPGGPYCPPQ